MLKVNCPWTGCKYNLYEDIDSEIGICQYIGEINLGYVALQANTYLVCEQYDEKLIKNMSFIKEENFNGKNKRRI